jgi:hypothetical protein
MVAPREPAFQGRVMGHEEKGYEIGPKRAQRKVSEQKVSLKTSKQL